MPQSQTLKDLTRHLNLQLPNILGAAQTRLGGNAAFVLPDDQYDNVRQQLGQNSNTEGFTLSGNASFMDNLAAKMFPFLASSPIMKTFSQNGPTVVTSQQNYPQVGRHEAIHAYLDNTPDLTPEQAINLIGPRGYANLSRIGYSPQAIREGGGEIPARLTTNPYSLGMTDQQGREAMTKYIKLLRRQDPAKAARLGKYLQLDTPPRDEGSFQKPNEVF